MFKKLTNTKTVLSIISMIILILMTLEFNIDNEKIETIAKAICTILVMLGIMNDNGMKTTKWNI